ncbi:peptidoglycan DD-metalloendopeptidase family protein [Candidatus Uhrbacteria bacterium]|nr:peptidoglycan DD-metalloendopeptidase family protein [Candidatus Uhrbacteria bacterium]MBD3284203.1 peptidoglycan DD-metalloendopeptidase family protein [Candidatus Uhrbacteria bacterium]
MNKHPKNQILLSISIILFGVLFGVQPLFASDVDSLENEIERKQGRVKEIDSLIESYQGKIAERRNEAQNLENQIVLLDNRVTEKELAVERTQIEIESLTLEIELMGQEIDSQETRIDRQKALIKDLLRRINEQDEVTTFDVLLTQDSLSDFFREYEEIKGLESDLGNALGEVKHHKTILEDRRLTKEQKQTTIEDERRTLRKEMLALEAEQNFKESLIAQTKENEEEFQRILYELRQQQQSASNIIANLEQELQDRLRSVDDALARGDAMLNWPMDPSRGITAIFHDPGYPFRHLFEHPGIDLRASVGTTVKSAGGGYVAWNKTGRMYGNYTMVVHTGGLATVYAHLSKFLSPADTFVDRGDPIALSGGAAGAPGSGLSTGPHLHFEVRKDGIPVDPEHYLPQVPGSYYDYYEDYRRWKIRL